MQLLGPIKCAYGNVTKPEELVPEPENIVLRGLIFTLAEKRASGCREDAHR